MDPVLPPPPMDDRWTRMAMPLADLEVVLGIDHALAADWVGGRTTTVLGTSIRVREPLVPTVDSPGLDPHLPLVAVAELTLLTALINAGADADNLRSVARNLDVEHGGPVGASRLVAYAMPRALAVAADRYEDASMLAPLSRAGTGWVFADQVIDVLDGYDYDEDGWVTRVRLVDEPDVRIVATSAGCHTEPDDDQARTAAALALFRRGRSLGDAAAAAGLTSTDVEAALRVMI